MTPERWKRITALFHRARALPLSMRGGFLDDACVDAELRAEVDAMLAADREAGRFGEVPVVAVRGDAEAGGSPALSARHTCDDDPVAAAAAQPEVTRRGRHPFVWIACVVALGTAAAFASALWGLILNGGTASGVGWDEVRRHGEWFVTRVEPSGPSAGAVEEGDRLVTLDGIPPIGPTGTTLHRRTLRPGGVYRIVVERDGKRRELQLGVSTGPNVLARSLTYFVVSLVWCAIGLFIGFARPGQPAARLACGAAVMTGLNFLNTLVQSGPLFHPMHIVVGYHFFCRFPTGHRVVGAWKRFLAVLYPAAALAVGIGAWLHGALLVQGVAGAARFASLFDVRAVVARAVYYPSLALIVAAAAIRYRRLETADERRRVRWIACGSVVALAPQIVWSGFELVGRATPRWFNLAADACTVMIPLAVAYAVVRHRVFDIRVAVRLGFRYALAARALQLAVAIPLAVLAFTVVAHRDRTVAELMTDGTAYLYWVGIAGLSLRYRRRIHLWLDRRFFREEYDREHVLLGVVDDLGAATSIADLSALVDAKVQSALHPSSLFVWYRDAADSAALASSHLLLTPPSFPAGDGLLAWLEERGDIAELPLPAAARLSPQDSRWLHERGVSLLIPIAESSDRLAGVLLLGPKKSDEPYSVGDRQLLRAIAKQTSVVRENLRLRAAVNDAERIRRDVLAKLDSEQANLLKECPECGACFDRAVECCDRDGHLLTLSLPVSRVLEGKYRLDRLIGRGGMGAVYEACDLRLERTVAVKVLRGYAFGEQEALRRFRAEARAAARLNHPRIVSVYDYGALEREGAYIVMEYVRGVTLRDEIGRVVACTPRESAEWFDQVLEGLAAAHAHGIVHRDLKPENIIGCRDDARRLAVKILDFGLAKVIGAEAAGPGTLTAEGVVVGTLGYMSPEQVLGSTADHRADIFAVGVMLAEALTGRAPFVGDTRADLARAVVHDTYRLPCSSPAASAVDELLQRCLAKHPRDRVASAAALRRALIPLLLACPPSSFAAAT